MNKTKLPPAEELENQVEHYLPLVRHIASKLSFNLPPVVEYADLVAMGMVGLLDALSRFDADRGIKFETYAGYRIRGEILNQLNKLSWVPRTVREKTRHLQKAAEQLQEELGRAPNESEISKAAGLSLHAYQRLLAAARPGVFLSLDGPKSLEDEPRLRSSIAEDPASEVERRLTVSLVAAGLQMLPERERLVVTLYFYEDLTLREIGEVLEVSEARSCQILSKAMGRLKDLMKRQNSFKETAGYVK